MPRAQPSLVLALVAGAGCGAPNLESGAIACGPAESCPNEMTCGGDGLCYRGSAGGGPIDAPRGDPDADLTIRIQAEDYDRRGSLNGIHVWETSTTVPAYEGAG